MTTGGGHSLVQGFPASDNALQMADRNSGNKLPMAQADNFSNLGPDHGDQVSGASPCGPAGGQGQLCNRKDPDSEIGPPVEIGAGGSSATDTRGMEVPRRYRGGPS